MKMYRNYDGNRSTFGDTSVAADGCRIPTTLSAFAAQRSTDSALTVMVINKALSSATPPTVNLANFTPARPPRRRGSSPRPTPSRVSRTSR